ncbi:MAG: HNH endonuclease [Neisseriaceae bacterium]|nr:MAG: HNH endonuclease [Neisseriaceae bacterium]
MQEFFVKISLSGHFKAECLDDLNEVKKSIINKLELIDGIDLNSFEIDAKDKKLVICEYPIEKVSEKFDTFHKNASKSIPIETKEKIYSVRLKAQKYRVFKENLQCVVCGLKASKVFLEIHPPDSPTLSFYGVHNKELVLFTKDHIHPKSHGGKDIFSNYQTMCSTCNSIKSNFNINLLDIKKLRNKFEENLKNSKVGMNQEFCELREKLAKPLNSQEVKNENNFDVKVICDLHVFKNEKGQLEADYFSFVKDSVGCIKRNTFLKSLVAFKESNVQKIMCQLGKNENDFVIIKRENVLLRGKKIRKKNRKRKISRRTKK